jgi:molybdate/tungstate transport system ATP-binding protein
MGGKLSLRNISKDFDGFKIDDLSLTVQPGEYLVLIGPTGAGKTLLLETIQGFHRLDKGFITLNDADITMLPQSQRRIAYVPQNPYFPPQNTVQQVLEFGVNKLNYSDAQPMLKGITQMMKLTSHLDRQVVTLSGGEKRKLALARALLQQPLLLLLDEPLNNLDTISKHGLREEIATIHRYLDLTVIHVTHDQTEALTLADRIAVVRNGRLVTKGTVEHVYNNPKDEYAARFLGYQNIYDISSVEEGNSYSKIMVGNVTLRASNTPEEDQKKIAIHGSEIILHRKTPMNTDDNIYQAEVTRIVTTGPTAYITVDFGLPLILTMGRRPYKATKLKVREKLWVQFSTDAVKPIRA